jgi:hypothetical protein
MVYEKRKGFLKKHALAYVDLMVYKNERDS